MGASEIEPPRVENLSFPEHPACAAWHCRLLKGPQATPQAGELRMDDEGAVTIHYHGTPITPIEVLYTLAGNHFCVSHAAPQDVARVHQIGQTVMLDNGAFTQWRSGKPTNWPAYYAWCERWLHCPTTWAIPPDVIDAPSQMQDGLLNEWPHGKRQAAPVWHMDEPISRLCRLVEIGWFRVCIGSTAEYMTVLSDRWVARMDDVWNELITVFGYAPPIHMLRGMQLSGGSWPFYSVDSTDIARNHHLPHKSPQKMAARWNGSQCAMRWKIKTEAQAEMDIA